MFGPYIDPLLRKYVGREGIRKGMVFSNYSKILKFKFSKN